MRCRFSVGFDAVIARFLACLVLVDGDLNADTASIVALSLAGSPLASELKLGVELNGWDTI